MKLKSVLFALPLMLPIMAAAGTVDLTRRDAACSHIATVQYLDCEVAVLYSCPAAGGVKTSLVREEAYTDQGYDHFEVDTSNGGMVVTGDAKGSYVIRSTPASLVETPLAEVIKTGKGAFVAQGSITLLGIQKPAAQKISIAATGETLTLSGQALTVFTADVTIDLPQPMGPSNSISKAYLMPSLGVYLAGEETSGTFFKPDNVPHKPMSISLPGQPGFDAIKPSTCGGSFSMLVIPTFSAATAPEGVPS